MQPHCQKTSFDSRVRNEPNASLLALGDCARVTYPAALQRCKFDTPLLAAGLLIEGLCFVKLQWNMRPKACLGSM
jgi:hypothetical protein